MLVFVSTGASLATPQQVFSLTPPRVAGMACLYRTDFLTINGFDSGLGGWGGEDLRFARRVSNMKYTITRYGPRTNDDLCATTASGYHVAFILCATAASGYHVAFILCGRTVSGYHVASIFIINKHR